MKRDFDASEASLSRKEATSVANLVENISINLLPEEDKLIQTLINAADAYETNVLPVVEGKLTTVLDPGQKIQIRIAGGWVRDKILKSNSNDIDVALDCMSGYHFATIVQNYLCWLEKGTTNTKGNAISSHKIGVISANPSQSKHLETATMKIYGIDVDFVNLRAEEVYDGNSRIPTKDTRQFGTPTEDALRRDFTINSLFYNIRIGKVEDFTGRGVSDLLDKRVLVTPLDPRMTFDDDPLRLLRAVRFGVRFDLPLHNDIREAAMDSKIHHSLLIKVSRERVGKEIEGMLTGEGAKPGLAFEILTKLKLSGCVFCFPPCDEVNIVGKIIDEEYSNVNKSHLQELGWLNTTYMLKILPKILEIFDISDETLRSSILRSGRADQNIPNFNMRLLYLSVVLYPFRQLSYTNKKNKNVKVTEFMVREGVKFKNRDVASIANILDNVDRMGIFLQQSHCSSFNVDRLKIGLLIRDMKDLWVTALLLATAADIHSYSKLSEGSCEDEFINKILQNSRSLYINICNQNLNECWKMKPLIDGRAIIKVLDLPKGPIVGKYLQQQIEWMLLYPNGSLEECETYLRQKKFEYDKQSSQET